jgi:aryl-alcohol dehydrogenase-like predicted oxidoreductase
MKMGDGANESGASRQHILAEIEQSLKRLQTDYVDLYQIHRADPNTPIEETLETLDLLVSQGKVRYIGCSNYQSWQVCEAIWTSRTRNLVPFSTVQPH